MMVRRAPVTGGLAGGVAVLGLSPTRAGGETPAQENGGTADTRIGKLDQLYNIRWAGRQAGGREGLVTSVENNNKEKQSKLVTKM